VPLLARVALASGSYGGSGADAGWQQAFEGWTGKGGRGFASSVRVEAVKRSMPTATIPARSIASRTMSRRRSLSR
jgi:hypothetical protein